MKIGVVLLSIILSVFFLVPSFLPEGSPVASWFPGKKLNLGLDLKGGIHVLLGVDVKKALDVEVDQLASSLQNSLDEETSGLAKVTRQAGTQNILVTLDNPQQSDFLENLIREDFYQRLVINSWETDKQAILKMELVHVDYIKEMSLEQAREIIRNRVDEFGVAEPIIAIEGDDRILVQLPGVSDPERAIELIGKTALLEYKLVDDEALSVGQLDSTVEKHREAAGFTSAFTRKQLDDLNTAARADLPADRIISFEKEVDSRGGSLRITPYLLEKTTVLTGNALEDARVTTNPQNNRPQVSLTFTKEGAEAFEQITGDSVGRRLAILLDGIVISAPVIQGKIPAISRGATITLGQGDRSQLLNEARDLALVLRSGALPAPVEILENRTVGASLGQDSINAGKLAGLLAAGLVLLFMLIYYRGSGLIADISVSINLLMLMAIMAFFQATLTLPGIAGIVLTIGMAVDANVIILERIREELRGQKKRVRAAIESGYEAAHSAILDANITTAIAAIVLFNFGSGPIRGFAITLLIGIVCSYVSAVWFSRWIYEWVLTKRQIEKLSI